MTLQSQPEFDSSARPSLIGRFIGPSLTKTVASADRTALIGLLVANLMPIIFALLFRWDIGGVAMFYWWENIVIGMYAILRIALAAGKPGSVEPPKYTKIFLVPFFCFHYFFFCMVHGVFLLVFFVGPESTESIGRGDMDLPGPLFVLPVFGSVMSTAWNSLPTAGVFSVGLLLGSHGLSFARNFLARGEFKNAVPVIEMFRPYGRIVLLHLSILFGGFVTLIFGSPLLLVFLLMVGKTALDVAVHSATHRLQRSHSPSEQ